MTIAIRIPEPCHEDWNAMHPRTGGRHCDRCAHTVLDLTRATDAELIDLVRRDAMPRCARFHQSQLDRVIVAQDGQGPNLLAAAAAGAALLLSTPDAGAQQGRPAMPKGKMVVAPTEVIHRTLLGEVERVATPPVPEPATMVAGRIALPPQQPEGTTAPDAPDRADGAVRIAGGKVAVQQLDGSPCAGADAKDAFRAVQVITGGPTEDHGDVPWTDEQVRTITGRVLERAGDPLRFATLVWENGEHAGSTDFEGRFTLRLTPVNPSAGFVVRSIGFRPQAVAIVPKPASAPCSGEHIIGDVVDAEGKPLAHCTVAIESLQLACITDAEGRFAFDLPTEGLPAMLIVMAEGGQGGGAVRIRSAALPQCVRITLDGGAKHATVQARPIDLGDVVLEEDPVVLGEVGYVEVARGSRLERAITRPIRWAGRRMARLFR